MDFTNNLAEAEKLDKFKSKVLKYVLYKKRTEAEVRKKFENDPDSVYLEDVISDLKEYKYLGDYDYIERSLNEFKSLKNLSIKEIKYKLSQKEVDISLLEDYIEEHIDELLEYEVKSAKNIVLKKSKDKDLKEIKEFLFKKGYSKDSIEIAVRNYNE